MSLGRRFQNSRTPRLIVGEKALLSLPDLLKEAEVRSICLIGGGASFDRIALSEELLATISHQGIRVELFRHSGEPSPESVDRAVELIREQDLQAVVGVGGGSTIDLAKAAAAVAEEEGPTIDYLEGVGSRKPAGRRLPLFAAPTTAGTGSEATKNAVLSRIGDGGFKKSLRHEAFIPDAAILDPAAAVSCPREVTAASGLDAITQLLEAYVSTAANPFTDCLAAEGLRKAGWSFERVLEDPQDLQAREAMALAAYYSGVCLANAGLGFVHGAASPIGAMRPVPHGTFCGLTLCPSVEETLPLLDPHDRAGSEALRKYHAAAGFLSPEASDSSEVPDIVNRLRRLAKAAALPTLKSFGFTRGDLDKVAAEAGVKNHPADLDLDTKVRILTATL
ncbi:MAG: iron-containing alcohol dehydrogenase [Spirochaetota bacterium]